MDTKIERIMLLNVPIDIVTPEDLPEIISRLVQPIKQKGNPDQKKKVNDIVLLSVWDLLKARRNNDYRKYIFNATLVLPISKSIINGAKFLRDKTPVRYMPFNFVISLLTLLEKHDYPVYLLGGKPKVLKKAEKNIHSTFPHLNVVGRCEGYLRRQTEPAVMEAIRRASPCLLLAGKGIRGGELWIAKNSERINTGFRMWCSDLFDVFAEKKQRPSDSVFEKGLESIGFCFRNPLLCLRIFPYLYYKFLLLHYKLFRQ